MRRRRWLALLMVAASGASTPGWGSFSSKGLVALSASATVSAVNISIQVTPLFNEAIFIKNLVIPIVLTSTGGPINPNNLRVDIVFQLLDRSGVVLNPPTPVPIQFIPGAGNGNTLQGSAIIPRSLLLAVQQGGSVTYVFQAKQGGAGVILTQAGPAPAPPDITNFPVLPTPFVTAIHDPWCEPVVPSGSKVSALDLAEPDGHTSITLPPGAVAAPGNLCIHVENPESFPSGPGGSKPAAIYTVSLLDTSLSGAAQLTLTYPSDLKGKVLDLGSDPATLGIYWLDQNQLNSQWRPLSRATLDSTLHILTGTTPQLATFALFPAGAIGSAELRPNERIITPNGDGINDKAIFGTGIDEVKIFDVRGRRVKSIAGPAPQWDGTDDKGSIVESGVYIYQFTASGDRISGVIMVAK